MYTTPWRANHCCCLLFKQIRLCTWLKEQKKFRSYGASRKKYYITYGVPNIVQHDQGPEFTSKVVKHLRITNNYLYVLYKEIQFVRQCIELITTYRNTRNSHNSSKLIIDLLPQIKPQKLLC